MKANYLYPWHKVNIWFSPRSRILAASCARDGAVNYPVPILRRYEVGTLRLADFHR